jgi:hypothetical protein
MGFLNRAKETAQGPVAWGAIIFCFISIFVAIFYASWLNTNERNRAVSDFCLVQEERQLDLVINLRRTYQYLDNLTPAQRIDPNTINPVIIQGLPEQEEGVKKDLAPEVCDDTYNDFFGLGEDKDYGNPEPDPVIPERPESLKDL